MIFLPPCSARSPFNQPAARLRRLALTTLAALMAAAAAAQDSTLTRLVRQNQLPLVAAGAQFSGAGWDKLRQDVQKSQFVLVGEDHGLAQIPSFTAALARELKPAVFVAEIDKYQAQDLSRLAAQPGLPVAFSRQHIMALSFYSWAEEFELARGLRAQNVALMGIDQVSCFSPGRFYARLAEQTKNQTTRTYLRRRGAAYQAHDRAMMSRDPGQMTIMQQPPAALDSLVALARPESPAVRQMVQDYVVSARIYQLAGQPKKGLQSHQARISLMKRNLLQGLQARQQPGQPLPKILFKLGAFHVSRGRSLTAGVYDVGNLALNLADIQDQQSLHIYIFGKQGTKAEGFNPDDFSKNVATYTNADEAALKPFMAQTSAGPTWQAFDLRPLRRALLGGKLKVSEPDLEIVILGYDYVVVIPETTASHNY
ncbi:hypothetical protein [uncultured Hymenobacter sp.]|uniref:hypothetical protein n=1 Tax=uncultured Hymenobacter sp. TaxID=170016 RepID=UPI0035CC6860